MLGITHTRGGMGIKGLIEFTAATSTSVSVSIVCVPKNLHDQSSETM